MSPKNSTSHSEGSSSSHSQEWSSLRHFLPRFVPEARKFKSIAVVHRVYDGTVDVRLEFEGNTDQAKEQFRAIDGRDETEAGDEAVCDGICGRIVRSEEIAQQFGLCEHNICLNCTSPSGGCTNSDCLQSESSSDSGSDLYSGCILITVFIKIMYRLEGMTLQQASELDIRGNATMGCVVQRAERLLGSRRARNWFIVPRERYSREELRPFSPHSQDRKKLSSFAGISDTLTLVIDTV